MTFLPTFFNQDKQYQDVVAKTPSTVGHTVTEKLAILSSLMPSAKQITIIKMADLEENMLAHVRIS